MFRLLKHKNICAPIAGTCLELEQCKDETFSSKALGDGFMIIPSENVVKSPCNGIINSIFPTKHAITLTSVDGKEILLHIGIDTVRLEGKYFTSFVSKGKKVKVGTPLIQFDEHYMKEHNIDMSTIVILLNGGKYQYTKLHMNDEVVSGEEILKTESGD